MSLFKKKTDTKVLSTIRSKKLEIQNPGERTQEDLGFDDMLALSLGDNRKVSKPDSQTEIENDKVNDTFNKALVADKTTRALVGILLVILGLLVLFGPACYKKYVESTDGKIAVSYSKKEFEGKFYEDVVDMLKEKGFTNINLRKEADLINGWVNKEGSVKEVIFAGNSDYSKEDRFFPDVKITIVYHVFPDKKG